ncbi:HAD hydrolase-like protein [Paenibacillus sp. HJL G12]|uniref:HAD hydrolase-like protein n=2 Tax=Paenibacillus dendrobii TaxID=2691084 RepID=A0A7X3LF61_9BACL|nr:HAD hydrolase-like protein [Paenibacillus dendrobii]MWV43296.1 HAD hydrolase-like protein [Paenibacillus dendrobii]
MKYEAVLFDLDGTLTDPKVGITKSVQYALSHHGIQVDDPDTLIPYIGPPLIVSFQEIHSFSEKESMQLVEKYREYFKDRGIYENELYDGIQGLLEMLTQQGRKLIVATSKPTVFALEVLKHFGIGSYFEVVCGSNLDGTLSDKSEIINDVFKKTGVNKHAAIMIGDRKHDIIGARKNDIESISVGYGYGSDEELSAIQPTYYVKTVLELQEFFANDI